MSIYKAQGPGGSEAYPHLKGPGSQQVDVYRQPPSKERNEPL